MIGFIIADPFVIDRESIGDQIKLELASWDLGL
jgi:hypothetical protein